MGDWRFLSNHGYTLLCIARDPNMRMRDIADSVGITERAAHRIVSELVEGGYVNRARQGNRNHYEVQPDVPMRHPLVQEHSIGEILAVLANRPEGDSRTARADGLSERRRGERRAIQGQATARSR